MHLLCAHVSAFSACFYNLCQSNTRFKQCTAFSHLCVHIGTKNTQHTTANAAIPRTPLPALSLTAGSPKLTPGKVQMETPQYATPCLHLLANYSPLSHPHTFSCLPFTWPGVTTRGCRWIAFHSDGEHVHLSFCLLNPIFSLHFRQIFFIRKIYCCKGERKGFAETSIFHAQSADSFSCFLDASTHTGCKTVFFCYTAWLHQVDHNTHPHITDYSTLLPVGCVANVLVLF